MKMISEPAKKVQKIICYLVWGIFLIIFGSVFLRCLISTGYNIGTEGRFGEDVLFYNDFIIINIIEMAIWVGIVFGIVRLLAHFRRFASILLIVSIVIAGSCSLLWVVSLNAIPLADQNYISQVAVQMNHGDFSSLEKGGYVAIHQQQLGMVTILRIFFGIFGDMKWLPFQVFNSLFVPVIVFAGYQITRILSGNNIKAMCIYLMLVLTFIPMYIYTSYVYGEIMSTALSMVGIWMLLECYMSKKTARKFSLGFCVKLLILAVSMGVAVQIRENSLIIVIAILSVNILTLFRGDVCKSVTASLATIIGVLFFWILIHQGIYGQYIAKDVEGMPATLYIAMGMNDDGVNAGYINDYNRVIFEESDYNATIANEKAKEKMTEYLEKYTSNPTYAIDFYARKIEGQWNVPMLQCLPMNGRFDTERISGVAKKVYYGSWSRMIEYFMNIWQQLLYIATIFAVWKMRKTWQKSEQFILPIVAIGGFLFSIMWEAKARYILIYIIMMIPLAAIGLQEVFEIKHMKKRLDK